MIWTVICVTHVTLIYAESIHQTAALKWNWEETRKLPNVALGEAFLPVSLLWEVMRYLWSATTPRRTVVSFHRPKRSSAPRFFFAGASVNASIQHVRKHCRPPAAGWLSLWRCETFLKLTVQIIHAHREWLSGWIWLDGKGQHPPLTAHLPSATAPHIYCLDNLSQILANSCRTHSHSAK